MLKASFSIRVEGSLITQEVKIVGYSVMEEAMMSQVFDCNETYLYNLRYHAVDEG